MKFILIIGLFLSLGCRAQHPLIYYSLLNQHFPSVPISDIKNPRIIPNSTAKKYVAFGNVVKFDNSDSVILFIRVATSHLQGGVPTYNVYSINRDAWGGYNSIRSDTIDNRDTWATTFNDIDSGVIWSCLSHNGLYSDWSTKIYQIRFDRALHFSDTIMFRWPAGIPKLQRGYFYGKAAHTDSAGHYLIPLFQFNVDTGNLSHTRVDMIRTTDYFRSYDYVNVWDGTSFPVSEGSVEYLVANSGKLGFWLRVDLGSQLYYYESTNYGASWTAKGTADSLYWWREGDSYMPYVYRATDIKTNIAYGDRDNDFIDLSLFNDPATFYGTHHFNTPELYYYNRSEDAAGANSSLNYPSMVNIKDTSVYLITFAHEISSDTAYIVYSRDNFKTDPAGVPIAPPTINPSSISTTGFRIDITGYTQAQLNNIRYFQFDMSTDPGFGSFVSAKYQSPTLFPSNVTLQNIRMISIWDTYSNLVTGTTYYLRIRACNNVGCSSYTTINVTTF